MPSNMRSGSPLASSWGISRYMLKSASRYSSNESAPFLSSALASASIAAISAVLLHTHFNTVDDARKAAIADADNPKIGPVDSITIDPIGEPSCIELLRGPAHRTLPF